MFHSLTSKSIARFVARGGGPTSESGEIRERRPTSSVSGLDDGVASLKLVEMLARLYPWLTCAENDERSRRRHELK